MGLELVILDFDGTLTDIEKEAVTFVEGYKGDVTRVLGISKLELEIEWAAAQSRIQQNLSRYGMVIDGRIVAPAYGDPILMAETIVGILLDNRSLHTDERDRIRLLQQLYQDNYARMLTFFREDTDEFLTTLKSQFNIVIVTNSNSDKVSRKLQNLPNHANIPIYGNAQKYWINPNWTAVPESVKRPSFDRPLYLRRQQYWNVLQGIMKKRKLMPRQVLVLGDIYEMDLLLPEHIGVKIVYLAKQSSPRFEIQAIPLPPSGYVAYSLEDVLRHLQKIK